MKKKFICTVCGYIHEGEEAPEKCPLCGAPANKFNELTEDTTPEFAAEHKLGIALEEDVPAELLKHCRMTFAGECTEVGMYLAMARQADREGYPEIARAFEHYAMEEANHAARYAEFLGSSILHDTTLRLILKFVWLQRRVQHLRNSKLQNWLRLTIWTLFMTVFMRWLATKLATQQVLWDFTSVILRINKPRIKWFNHKKRGQSLNFVLFFV